MALLSLLVIAAVLMGTSGVACLLLPRRWGKRDAAFAAMMSVGGTAGVIGSIWSLIAGIEQAYQSAWSLPWGSFSLRLDPISAAFLVPVYLVPALGAVFGAAYWREADHPATAARLRVFYGLMPAAMVGVILAQSGVLLLLSWEVMAISAFMAIATEDTDPAAREAGWVYFVATHLGTLALFAFFALLSGSTGSFDLTRFGPGAISGSRAAWLFALGLVGFGLKAGVMPLHVWLPGAHANAPSHVSAVLSGVMLKVGVYGIVRVCWMLTGAPAWWGWVLMALGGASAVMGIAFALGQHDYKRMLAYSSIENVGIIVLAIGVAMLGRSTGNVALTTLGIAGALLHTWNHALFKSSLFLVSGALLHATGTRRMNALGGLVKRMPRVAALALVACVAISTLPPLNGFVGEWMIYAGMIGSMRGGPAVTQAPLVLGVVTLALAGALALAVFSRFFGAVFLGQARSDAMAGAHDPPPAMLAPIGVLVALCVVLGIVPRLALSAIEPAAASWIGAPVSGVPAWREASGALSLVSLLGASVTIGAIVMVWRLHRQVARSNNADVGTWDCGYARPSARMQYTESSFADILVGIFRGVLWPRRRSAHVEGMFPAPASFESETPDVVLDRGVVPTLGHATRWLMRLRMLQQGRVQTYILYVFLGLIVLLIFG